MSRPLDLRLPESNLTLLCYEGAQARVPYVTSFAGARGCFAPGDLLLLTPDPVVIRAADRAAMAAALQPPAAP